VRELIEKRQSRGIVFMISHDASRKRFVNGAGSRDLRRSCFLKCSPGQLELLLSALRFSGKRRVRWDPIDDLSLFCYVLSLFCYSKSGMLTNQPTREFPKYHPLPQAL